MCKFSASREKFQAKHFNIFPPVVPPRIKYCDTYDGVSLDMDIVDADNVYDFKQDYRISWNKFGDSDSKQHKHISNLSFHIGNLGKYFCKRP